MLSRRNIARIIAVIAAAILAFHTATAALSPSDEALSRKASATMCKALSFEDALPSGEAPVAVSDHLFEEFAEVFFLFRHLVTGGAASTTGTHIATPVPSFTAEDRRMLRQIHRATVYGETPTEAQIAGDVRRRQVLYGAELYRPTSKYVKGVSSYAAAEKAIRAPQFSDVEGAYRISEKESLARAIRRERASLKGNFGT